MQARDSSHPRAPLILAAGRAADALSGDAPVTVCCPDVHRGNTWIDAGPSDGGKERWEEWVASHPAERVAKDIAAVVRSRHGLTATCAPKSSTAASPYKQPVGLRFTPPQASALKEGGASTVVVVGCGWHPAIAAALAADAGQPSAFTYARCPALEALLTSLGSAAGGGGGPSAGAGAEQERDLLVENAAADAIEELRKAIATA